MYEKVIMKPTEKFIRKLEWGEEDKRVVERV
jgi:hypothetical protein